MGKKKTPFVVKNGDGSKWRPLTPAEVHRFNVAMSEQDPEEYALAHALGMRALKGPVAAAEKLLGTPEARARKVSRCLEIYEQVKAEHPGPGNKARWYEFTSKRMTTEGFKRITPRTVREIITGK